MWQAINSLYSLRRKTPGHLLDALADDAPLRQPLTHDPADVQARAISLFDTIYGRVSAKVRSNLRSAAPDLLATADLEYGWIFGETRVLSALDTSWVLIGALTPQDVNAQLKGHLRGGVNNGGKPSEAEAVKEMTMMVCEAVWGGDRGWRKGREGVCKI